MSLVNDNDSLKSELCSKLNFSSVDLNKLLFGRLSVTPVQLTTIANTVHCMSSFSTKEHCNEVLDIIDSYIDIKEAVC